MTTTCHPTGHNIGLTSGAMQRAAQIDKPDYGTQLDDMLLPAGHDESALHAHPLQPGEIILNGSFTVPVSINRGDVFHADCGARGPIVVRFA